MRIAAANNGLQDAPSAIGSETSLIDSVEVTLEAYLGKSRITINDLKALKPDATITLDESLGSAVELRLNDRAVARGELVAVGEKFGVRLTEIGR